MCLHPVSCGFCLACARVREDRRERESRNKKLCYGVSVSKGVYLEGALLGWNQIKFDYNEQREDT